MKFRRFDEILDGFGKAEGARAKRTLLRTLPAMRHPDRQKIEKLAKDVMRSSGCSKEEAQGFLDEIRKRTKRTPLAAIAR